MQPREASGVGAPQGDTKLPPVTDLARWLWVDDCIREVTDSCAEIARAVLRVASVSWTAGPFLGQVLPASLLQKQRLLIVGGSGMGKTMLTRQLVLLICDAQRNVAKGSALLLPIRVPLIDIATLCERKGETDDQDYDLFEEHIETTWGVNSIPVQLYRHAKRETLSGLQLRVLRI